MEIYLHNAPDFITNDLVNQWTDKINYEFVYLFKKNRDKVSHYELLQKYAKGHLIPNTESLIKGVEFLPNHALNLTFDDRLEKRRCGQFSMEQIQEIMFSKYHTNDETNELFFRIRQSKYDRMEEQTALFKNLFSLNPDVESGQIIEEYLKLKKNQLRIVTLKSEYVFDKYEIVLYPHAIETSFREPETLLHCYESAFAREFCIYFMHILALEMSHLLENNDASYSEFLGRKDYASKVVKETLAAEFEFFYDEQYGIEYYSILDHFKVKPGILYDSKTNYCPWFSLQANFEQAFYDSITNLNSALRELWPNDYFDIVNRFSEEEKYEEEKKD